MRNRPPNLSTVGGVDRQTDISNERLRTISCIGVKQIPQKYRRLVMGSLGSQHKQPVLTHRPSNKLIPCWLTTTAWLHNRTNLNVSSSLRGGLTLSNIHQIGEHTRHVPKYKRRRLETTNLSTVIPPQPHQPHNNKQHPPQKPLNQTS